MAGVQLYLRMLLRSWWIVALTTLAAFNVTLGMLYFATPLYQTNARFIINPSQSVLASEDLSIVRSIEVLDRRSVVSTYAEVLGSPSIHQKIAKTIGLTPLDLAAYTISAVVLPDSNILELSIQGPDPAIAAQLANKIGQEAIDFVNQTYLVYDINLLDPASPPAQPISPKPTRDLSLAIALGAVLGSLLAILREHVNMPLDSLRQRFAVDNASSAYTRRFFEKQAEEKFTQGEVDSYRLGLIQLSGLQDLTNTLPPFLIERLLRDVTKTLRNELRGSDLIGRWDDNSFAIMLSPVSNVVALDTFERIQQALSKPFPLYKDSQTVLLKPRIGVAVQHGDESVESLIEHAAGKLGYIHKNGTDSAL